MRRAKASQNLHQRPQPWPRHEETAILIHGCPTSPYEISHQNGLLFRCQCYTPAARAGLVMVSAIECLEFHLALSRFCACWTRLFGRYASKMHIVWCGPRCTRTAGPVICVVDAHGGDRWRRIAVGLAAAFGVVGQSPNELCFQVAYEVNVACARNADVVAAKLASPTPASSLSLLRNKAKLSQPQTAIRHRTKNRQSTRTKKRRSQTSDVQNLYRYQDRQAIPRLAGVFGTVVETHGFLFLPCRLHRDMRVATICRPPVIHL